MPPVIKSLLGAAILAATFTTAAQTPRSQALERLTTEPATSGNVRPQIIGGERADPKDHPYYVGLMVRQIGYVGCGGTLVAPDWIVTAKHCNFHGVEVPESGIEGPVWMDVIHGMTDRTKMDGRRVKVVAAFDHPDPSMDLALMKLETPLPYTPVIVPLLRSIETAMAPPGTMLSVVGYGVSSPDLLEDARYLQKLDVKLLSDRTCSRIWEPEPDEPPGITTFNANTMICAGDMTETQSPCFGDSGGPLVRKWGRVPVLLGVVSWGSETCIAPEAPGVYARVSAAGIWIYHTMFAEDRKQARRSPRR